MSDILKPCIAMRVDKTIGMAIECNACPHRRPISLEALAKRVEQDTCLSALDLKRVINLIREYQKELNR